MSAQSCYRAEPYVRLLEQTAMRVGELQSLTWGDVDENGCRFRIRRESTKRKRPSFARYSRG